MSDSSGLRVWHRALATWNNVLLIPLFVLLAIDVSVAAETAALVHNPSADWNLFFCASFFLEWLLGLVLAEDRRAYVISFERIAELVSSIPFGSVFQAGRVIRLIRLLRVFRLIVRARHLRGAVGRMARFVLVALATSFSGGLALRVMEPALFRDNSDAFWWAVVTMSTVGYGDFIPQTDAGRLVASVVMVFGVAVIGYAAGAIATILEDPEEQEMLILLRRIDARLADLADDGT